MNGLHIGISGWRYAPWRGLFYPTGLRQQDELRYASHVFNSIELNGSFYGLQTPERYRGWHAQTPADFCFSVKGPRFITHIRRLRDPEEGLANFFASGPLELGEKLGAFLWQLPPSLAYDEKLLESFLGLLPRHAAAALEMARTASTVRPTALSEHPKKTPLRHAMEVRHHSFVTGDFVSQLRQHGVALVMADAPSKWPYGEDLTASDFIYMRLHGGRELYASGYDDSSMSRWADRVRHWRRGLQPADAQLFDASTRGDRHPREVFCYFDNSMKIHAPFDASRLMHLLEVRTPDRQLPGEPPGDWL